MHLPHVVGAVFSAAALASPLSKRDISFNIVCDGNQSPDWDDCNGVLTNMGNAASNNGDYEFQPPDVGNTLYWWVGNCRGTIAFWNKKPVQYQYVKQGLTTLVNTCDIAEQGVGGNAKLQDNSGIDASFSVSLYNQGDPIKAKRDVDIDPIHGPWGNETHHHHPPPSSAAAADPIDGPWHNETHHHHHPPGSPAEPRSLNVAKKDAAYHHHHPSHNKTAHHTSTAPAPAATKNAALYSVDKRDDQDWNNIYEVDNASPEEYWQQVLSALPGGSTWHLTKSQSQTNKVETSSEISGDLFDLFSAKMSITYSYEKTVSTSTTQDIPCKCADDAEGVLYWTPEFTKYHGYFTGQSEIDILVPQTPNQKDAVGKYIVKCSG